MWSKGFAVVGTVFITAKAWSQNDWQYDQDPGQVFPHVVFPLNGTAPSLKGNATYHCANTTGTGFRTGRSCATNTSTPTLETSCGKTSTPFKVQLALPSSPIDGWFLKVSGNSLLFAHDADGSSSFSVESTGHLCAVGKAGYYGYPEIAVAESREPTSPMYLLDARAAQNYTPQYVAPRCRVDSGILSCATNGTRSLLGCGLQLELGSQFAALDRGTNCSTITLKAIP